MSRMKRAATGVAAFVAALAAVDAIAADYTWTGGATALNWPFLPHRPRIFRKK